MKGEWISCEKEGNRRGDKASIAGEVGKMGKPFFYGKNSCERKRFAQLVRHLRSYPKGYPKGRPKGLARSSNPKEWYSVMGDGKTVISTWKTVLRDGK